MSVLEIRIIDATLADPLIGQSPKTAQATFTCDLLMRRAMQGAIVGADAGSCYVTGASDVAGGKWRRDNPRPWIRGRTALRPLRLGDDPPFSHVETMCCATAAVMRSPTPATTRAPSKIGSAIDRFSTPSGILSCRRLASAISGATDARGDQGGFASWA